MRVAEEIAATTAEYCADRWPEGRQARIDFMRDAVFASILAYSELGGAMNCPKCRMRLRVTLDMIGRKILCPWCRTGLRLVKKWLKRMSHRSAN